MTPDNQEDFFIVTRIKQSGEKKISLQEQHCSNKCKKATIANVEENQKHGSAHTNND